MTLKESIVSWELTIQGLIMLYYELETKDLSASPKYRAGGRIYCGTLEDFLFTIFTFNATHIQEHSLTEKLVCSLHRSVML